MINPCAPLLSKEIIDRAKALNVPLILDGLKAAKIDIPNGGCMDMHINPVDRGMTVVGTALTVESSDGDNFPIHVASYIFDAEGYVMVIDGCTRDRDGNIELNFPVYSRGFMPRGPIKKNEGNINTPIMCGGVKVNPGDLVVGDSDGVCVIPVEYIDVVLTEAEKKLAYEVDREETIAAYRKAKAEGTELPQLAPQWVLDMMK